MLQQVDFLPSAAAADNDDNDHGDGDYSDDDDDDVDEDDDDDDEDVRGNRSTSCHQVLACHSGCIDSGQ